MLTATHRGCPAAASAWRVPPLVIALCVTAWAVPTRGPADEPPARVLELDGARIRVILPERRVEAGEGAMLEWIATAAHAVAAYEGGFPVRSATVRIATHGGRGVGQGTARFAGSPEIRISVGEDTEREDLRRDWVMTHEMIHLGFPSVGDPHCWMEEGLATYVEPIARARVGGFSAEEAWGKLGTLLPKGLPKEGDGGLDSTATWARTYWGGAMFWLLTDVEIRSRTQGRRGLEDVLRAIVAAGGTIEQSWDVDRVIATGDRAAGAPVLRQLYERMAASPDRVDLPTLWASLGVRRQNGRVALDDRAPLASVRRAITRAEGNPRAPRSSSSRSPRAAR
jgi:hypothetical protein